MRLIGFRPSIFFLHLLLNWKSVFLPMFLSLFKISSSTLTKKVIFNSEILNSFEISGRLKQKSQLYFEVLGISRCRRLLRSIATFFHRSWSSSMQLLSFTTLILPSRGASSSQFMPHINFLLDKLYCSWLLRWFKLSLLDRSLLYLSTYCDLCSDYPVFSVWQYHAAICSSNNKKELRPTAKFLEQPFEILCFFRFPYEYIHCILELSFIGDVYPHPSKRRN